MSGNYDFLSRPEGVRCICGKWPGQPRWGDNACPNRLWRTGNGQPQWLERTFYRNGQPQWLERTFYRASIPTPPRA